MLRPTCTSRPKDDVNSIRSPNSKDAQLSRVQVKIMVAPVYLKSPKYNALWKCNADHFADLEAALRGDKYRVTGGTKCCVLYHYFGEQRAVVLTRFIE
jgi:hypothetical protein